MKKKHTILSACLLFITALAYGQIKFSIGGGVGSSSQFNYFTETYRQTIFDYDPVVSGTMVEKEKQTRLTDSHTLGIWLAASIPWAEIGANFDFTRLAEPQTGGFYDAFVITPFLLAKYPIAFRYSRSSPSIAPVLGVKWAIPIVAYDQWGNSVQNGSDDGKGLWVNGKKMTLLDYGRITLLVGPEFLFPVSQQLAVQCAVFWGFSLNSNAETEYAKTTSVYVNKREFFNHTVDIKMGVKYELGKK
jgi:hypothetical protein